MREIRTRTIMPEEEAAPYPYRRVWRSLVIETGLFALLTGVYFALGSVFGIRLPAVIDSAARIAVALAPALLWSIFTLLAERSAPQPRTQLLLVAVVTGLASNAITLPLINGVLQPESWLSNASAVTRIIGYTLAVGVAIEFTKYIVIRYSVWPGQFRIRLDGPAYALAASVGLATVSALHLVSDSRLTLDALAIGVFDLTITSYAACLIIGFGLSESALGQPTPFIGPVTLALAALIHGLAIPLRAGLGNATFTLAGGSARPVLGIGLSVGLLVAVAVLVSFLFSAADRREREAAAEEI